MMTKTATNSRGFAWGRMALSLLVLIVFYLLLGLLIGEIGVRLAKAAPPVESLGWFWRAPDPITGWQLEPNTSGYRTNEFSEYFASMAVNSRGVRGPEAVGYAKSPGAQRILVLGDSFIEAAQVEWEESLPQRLAQVASAQSGTPMEAVNAGVRAWGNDQELIWLQEEGYRYSPDLIVVAMFPQNDFMNNYEPLEAHTQGQIIKPFFALKGNQLRRNYWPFDPANVPPVEPLHPPVQWEPSQPGPLASVGVWLENHSFLYRYVEPRIRVVAPSFAIALAHSGLIRPGTEMQERAFGDGYIPPVYDVYRAEWTDDWQGAYTLTTAIFAELQRTAQAMGAQLAVVLIPAKEQVYPVYWEQILQKYPAMRALELDPDMPTTRAKEFLTRLGIPTVDLLETLRSAGTEQEDLYFVYDGHWTARGTELAAHSAYIQLAGQAILPAPNGDAPILSGAQVERGRWEWIVWAILALLAVSVLWDLLQNGPLRWTRKVVAGLSTTGELLVYLIRRRQYTLLPMIIVLLIFAGFLILAQASVVGPFIYTLI